MNNITSTIVNMSVNEYLYVIKGIIENKTDNIKK